MMRCDFFVFRMLLVLLCIVGSTRGDEETPDSLRDLHSRMRIRILPELKSRLPDKNILDDIQTDEATRKRLEEFGILFSATRMAFLRDVSSIEKSNRVEFERRTREFHQKYVAELLTILSLEQLERVQQIYLQERGSESLRQPEVIEWLAISKSQLREIIRIHGERGQKIQALLLDSPNPHDKVKVAEFRERARKIDLERNQKALAHIIHAYPMKRPARA